MEEANMLTEKLSSQETEAINNALGKLDTIMISLDRALIGDFQGDALGLLDDTRRKLMKIAQRYATS